MAITIRSFRENDIELLVVLLNAVEAADRVEQGTSVAEQREFLAMPGLRPEENVFVAEEYGRLVGVANIRLAEHDPSLSGFRAWFTVHPVYRGRGLEDRLAARLEQRARERMSETAATRVYFACAGYPGYSERLEALERAGMKEIRRFWRMLRGDLASLPAAAFPPGLIVRTLEVGRDDQEALDAMNDSFREHFGHLDDTMEWMQYYLHSEMYRADLTPVALDPATDRIAGFCHIVINRGECERLGVQRGWIDILGVRKEYRKQGLGEALLIQGMQNLREAGMTEAMLGCDAENTTNATRIYFRTGFQVRYTDILFEKWLRDQQPEQPTEAPAALAV